MHPILLLKKGGCAPGPHFFANRGDGPAPKGWEDHSAEQPGKLTDEHRLDGIEMRVHVSTFVAHFEKGKS